MSNSSDTQLALEKELEQVKRINQVVGRLINTIQVTGTNIQKTNEASQNTSILLNQWIRILSQTNFTNEIINNEVWNGKNIDITEDEIEEKLQAESKLEEELRALNKENETLNRKIEIKESEKKQAESKRNELINKRRNELGLGNTRLGNKRIKPRAYR